MGKNVGGTDLGGEPGSSVSDTPGRRGLCDIRQGRGAGRWVQEVSEADVFLSPSESNARNANPVKRLC